ncbi:MAG: radical SAM protein [Thermodesulfobacteriota bacterium]
MRVTLINPPALPGRFHYSAFCHPPLGLAYLAAFLRRHGHTVDVIDAVGEAIDRFVPYPLSRRFLRQGLATEDILRRIDPKSDLIGVSCMFSHTWPLVRDLVRQIRKVLPDVPVIAGGEHPTALFDLCLRQAPLDACVLGEGEETLVEIADALETGRPLAAIAGIAWKDPDTGEIHQTVDRPPIAELDSLPFPAWDLIPWKAYKLYVGPAQARTMTMLASRGCPHGCVFCSAPAMWKGVWRKRRPEAIVREMSAYVSIEHITEFQFLDISPLISREWIRDLCRTILARHPGIRWQMPVGGRPEVMDDDMAEMMLRSGCRHIQFAPESGSPAVLAAMNKHLDLDRFRQAVVAAKKAGMIVSALFVIGYPTETIKDIRRTYRLIRWLAQRDVDEIAISSFVLLPGTRAFADASAIRPVPVDDDFCYQTADATALVPSASWNPLLGKNRLLLLKWTGLIQFHAISLFRHPSRLPRMISNLMRGRQETKTERVLTEIIEKFRRRSF